MCRARVEASHVCTRGTERARGSERSASSDGVVCREVAAFLRRHALRHRVRLREKRRDGWVD